MVLKIVAMALLETFDTCKDVIDRTSGREKFVRNCPIFFTFGPMRQGLDGLDRV